MNLLRHINFKWFIFSFSLGLLIVYITTSPPSVVIKYPTPETSRDVVFKDDVENCYKFKATEAPCTKDTPNLPIQKNLEYFNI